MPSASSDWTEGHGVGGWPPSAISHQQSAISTGRRWRSRANEYPTYGVKKERYSQLLGLTSLNEPDGYLQNMVPRHHYLCASPILTDVTSGRWGLVGMLRVSDLAEAKTPALHPSWNFELPRDENGRVAVGLVDGTHGLAYRLKGPYRLARLPSLRITLCLEMHGKVLVTSFRSTCMYLYSYASATFIRVDWNPADETSTVPRCD